MNEDFLPTGSDKITLRILKKAVSRIEKRVAAQKKKEIGRHSF